MGFLEEIERRRQQQIQQELVRRAELERQQQIVAQDTAEWKRDRSTIANLLTQLNEFGYKGYFETVSKLSGFNLDQSIYTKTKSNLSGQSVVVDALSNLGWAKLVGEGGKIKHQHSDVVFFGDNVAGKIEPREVGIGIRFSKKRTDESLDMQKERRKIEYEFPTDVWQHSVYARINSQSKATITGSNQRQVDLKDLRLFDEVLEQAIRNPNVIQTRFISKRTYGTYSGGDSYGFKGEQN